MDRQILLRAIAVLFGAVVLIVIAFRDSEQGAYGRIQDMVDAKNAQAWRVHPAANDLRLTLTKLDQDSYRIVLENHSEVPLKLPPPTWLYSVGFLFFDAVGNEADVVQKYVQHGGDWTAVSSLSWPPPPAQFVEPGGQLTTVLTSEDLDRRYEGLETVRFLVAVYFTYEYEELETDIPEIALFSNPVRK